MAQRQTPKGKNYLLVIGIDNYPHFPKLFNAVKDANDVKELLLTRYQFDSEHVVTLFDEKATQDNILAALEKFAEQVTEEDSLLLYYSGHGEYKKIIDVGQWIPYDAEPGKLGSFISFDLVIKFIKAIKSRHTLIIADSCYSGALFSERSSTDKARDRLESLPSRWVLTAGRNEVVSDGKPGDNSPFADAVLYHLKNNEEPRFRVSDFCNAVIVDVGNNANQVPRGASLHGVGDRGGEFMFRLKAYVDVVFETPAPVRQEEPGPKELTRGGDSPTKPPTPQSFADIEALKDYLRTLVADDEMELALELLRKWSAKNRTYNDVILVQGRLSSLNRDLTKGVISQENAGTEKNRIRSAVNSLIDGIKAGNLIPGIIK